MRIKGILAKRFSNRTTIISGLGLVLLTGLSLVFGARVRTHFHYTGLLDSFNPITVPAGGATPVPSFAFMALGKIRRENRGFLLVTVTLE